MVEGSKQYPNSRERHLAAFDLGSNSFHLLIAQETNGRIQVIDRIREMVCLAEGLHDSNELTPEVMERALDCLSRFSQRLRGLQPQDIRVVGTNTLRRASNASTFLTKAEHILDTKVEVISGREEARLIYLGVSHSLEDNFDRRLVVDIGGGSTEIILGRSFRAETMESLHMGCVGITHLFFTDGQMHENQFNKAINRARQEMEPLAQSYLNSGWDTAIGASGTVLAIAEILQTLTPDATTITKAGLDKLRKVLVDAKHVDKISLAGLTADRARILPGGLAILCGIFESLQLEHMEATSGALREGLLYDLLGRVHDHDVRENSVADLSDRYHIDLNQARRVRESAIGLLAQVAKPWKLTARDELLLGWAADLHEIGMDIAHSQYHKHGGYLLQNMELPGFSRLDQIDLASLVRSHRRKIPLTDGVPSERILHLTVILRLATVLHRARLSESMPHIDIQIDSPETGVKVSLRFPHGWLDAHPLTKLDLEQEAQYLSSIPMSLEIDNSLSQAAS